MNDNVVQFITEPDESGLGRIIYNDRYYGLPVAIILDYKRLKEQQVNGVQPVDPNSIPL